MSEWLTIVVCNILKHNCSETGSSQPKHWLDSYAIKINQMSKYMYVRNAEAAQCVVE